MQFTYKQYIDGLPFVAYRSPLYKTDALLIENFKLESMIDYINGKDIHKVFIQNMSDYQFLVDCKNLEHIAIEFKLPFRDYYKAISKGEKLYYEYDLKPLYKINNLKSLTLINNEEPFVNTKTKVDLSSINGLEMYYGDAQYVKNIGNAYSLKSLMLNYYRKKDLMEFRELERLDSMQFISSSLKSLENIECLKNIKCLNLSYNRSLENIDSLANVKESLCSLKIENCSKIKDFSVLNKLGNIQCLELIGNNSIPNLNFLKGMKSLKVLLLDINVEDGNLMLCKNVDTVYCNKYQKHYNVKKEDLPFKNQKIIDFSDIEEWRLLD